MKRVFWLALILFPYSLVLVPLAHWYYGGYFMAAVVFAVAQGIAGSILLLLWMFKRCYIAGTTIMELGRVVTRLHRRNIGCTIDILGEHITCFDQTWKCLDEYISLITWMNRDESFRVPTAAAGRKSISVKLSHLGLKLDFQASVFFLKYLVEVSAQKGIFVWVDAEEKEILDDSMRAVETVRAQFPNVGIAIQSCHNSSYVRVARCCAYNIPVRLCKGAYPDGDIIDEEALRDAYVSQAKMLLEHGVYVGIASHDTIILNTIQKYVCDNNILADAFEFQMLLGVRVGLQEELANDYRVVVYLPFGKDYKKYLRRRFKEGFRNLGLVWMFIRNLKDGFIFSFKN